MKILSLGLENIRSHTKSLIHFGSGFNCLVGGVGAGKSTVLYAIDFVFFGDPIGRSYEYLLREGADVGRVAVKFTKDGKEYVVQRVLRRHNDRIAQDLEQLKLFEGDRLIAEMKSDAVVEQLQAILGFDKEIFREIMWVQQERLKEVLDLAPRERQRRLDQLFGLQDYEDSWAKMGPIIRWFESEKSTLERDPDILRIGEMRNQYEESVIEVAAKESEIDEMKSRLAEAERRFREVSTRWEQLDNLRQSNEKILREETETRARITGIRESIKRLSDEVEGRWRVVENLESQLKSLEDQENLYRKTLQGSGIQQDASLEKLQEYLETLQNQISRCLGEEESIKTEIKRLNQRISNLTRESECPLCLQPLSAEYKNRLLNQLNLEICENEVRMKSIVEDIARLDSIRTTVKSTIEGLKRTRMELDYTRRQIESEKTRIKEMKAMILEKENEEQNLLRHLESLRSNIREVDAKDLEKASRERAQAYEQLLDLQHKLSSLEFQKREILKRLETLKERLDAAEKKISRVERIGKIIDLAQEIRAAYRSIQPKLRGEFVAYLERFTQQILDDLIGFERTPLEIKIDENYTPIVWGQEGYERSAMNLSGGERTLLAFAYRIAIGQLVMQWKAGQGLPLLLLDEPTESLGREDGSVDRLAESLSRLRTVEQIIAVTHSEAFADNAEHVIRIEKQYGGSVVSVVR
ncbi:MAG: SMC family ATPase [Candidatus Bathyarchaeota archaeon]|nr:SMC family ATPase [Candidatus Bathyarchaeota archaeon]